MYGSKWEIAARTKRHKGNPKPPRGVWVSPAPEEERERERGREKRWETDLLPLLVLTRRGRSTGKKEENGVGAHTKQRKKEGHKQ